MDFRIATCAFLSLVAACFFDVLVRAQPLQENGPRGADAVELRRASTHPMRYYLALPRGYSKERDPRNLQVLVCVAGADSAFFRCAENYGKARGDLPFFVVAPCTFSNTNSIAGLHLKIYRDHYTEEEIQQAEHCRVEWDEAGLLAVLDDLKREFACDDRICLTGFSGGGILTYHMLVKHPERLHAAVPVCANYFGAAGAGGYEKPLSSRAAALPVTLLLGEFDQMLGQTREGILQDLQWLMAAAVALSLGVGFLVWQRTRRKRWVIVVAVAGLMVLSTLILCSMSGIESQSDAAVRRLHERGYKHVTVTKVPGMGHEPAADRVVEIFANAFGHWEHD